jgi:hypothetical protein
VIAAVLDVYWDNPEQPGATLTPRRDSEGNHLEVAVGDVDLALDIAARLNRDRGGSCALRVDPGIAGDTHTYTTRFDGLTVTVSAVEPAKDDAMVSGGGP